MVPPPPPLNLVLQKIAHQRNSRQNVPNYIGIIGEKNVFIEFPEFIRCSWHVRYFYVYIQILPLCIHRIRKCQVTDDQHEIFTQCCFNVGP